MCAQHNLVSDCYVLPLFNAEARNSAVWHTLPCLGRAAAGSLEGTSSGAAAFVSALQLQKKFLRDSLQQCGFSAVTAYMMVKDLGTAKINELCTGLRGPQPQPLDIWHRTLQGSVTAAALTVALQRTQL